MQKIERGITRREFIENHISPAVTAAGAVMVLASAWETRNVTDQVDQALLPIRDKIAQEMQAQCLSLSDKAKDNCISEKLNELDMHRRQFGTELNIFHWFIKAAEGACIMGIGMGIRLLDKKSE